MKADFFFTDGHLIFFCEHNIFQRPCEVEHYFGLSAVWPQVRPRLRVGVIGILSDSAPIKQEETGREREGEMKRK